MPNPTEITDSALVELILSLGYATIADYQRAYNLPATNQIDSATRRSLLSVRFCQLPELFSLDAAALNKWGKKTITWNLASSASLPGFSRDDLYDVFIWSFSQWAGVADLTFKSNINGLSSADITITTGRIDNPGNTLAWSELPGPNAINQQLTQKFDSSEPFVFSANPPPSKIDLGAVAVHEIGHALGLPHAPSNSRSLMAPVYSPQIRTPKEWDIAEIRRRYGQAVIPIPPSVPSDPSTPETPVNPLIPLPYDPSQPGKKIFPSGLALPKLAGYTWVAWPDAWIPPTK